MPTAWRSRALLSWLSLHPGSHRRADVAARFWPDILDASARASLRNALWALRRALGPHAETVLIATRDRIGVSAGPAVWIDTSAFAELLGHGRLEEALALCDGELLPDLDEDWVHDARGDHRARVAEVIERLAARAEDAGDLPRALALTHRWVELDPLDEAAQRELIRRLVAADDRPRAVAVYRRLRERLRAELGLSPSSATRELMRRLVHEPEQDVTTGARPLGGRADQPCGAGWRAGAAFPPPPALDRHCPSPFVGREEELAQLRDAWSRVRAGSGPALAVVAGEAGIGKSGLLAQLGRRACSLGDVVLYGACRDEALVPHEPFVEALRHFAGVSVPAELRRRANSRAAELAILLPEVAAGDAGAPPPQTPEELRPFVLLDAVARFLAELSREVPVLLLLDDVHWIDKSSIALLAHILERPEAARLLIVAAHRDRELGEPPVLDERRMRAPVARIELRGLAPEEVGELMRAQGGRPELAAALHGDTAGNPLFVRELLSHLAESGDRVGALPQGLTAVVRRRLERVPPEGLRLLELAAVIGQDFSLDVLEQVSGLAPDRVSELVDTAARARILIELPGELGRFAFSHAVVRQTLTEPLTRAHHARVHRRVAEAIEHLHADDLDPVLPSLAYHWSHAGAAHAHRAVEIAERAAQQAEQKLAHAEAVELYTRALKLLADDDARRRRLMLRRAVAYVATVHTVIDAPRAGPDGERPAEPAISQERPPASRRR